MPELPEVETIVRSLKAVLKSKQILKIIVYHSRPLGSLKPLVFKRLLQGKVFSEIKRRGKYICFNFEDNSSLIVHLRMTGGFLYQKPNIPEGAKDHLRLAFFLSDGSSLLYQDSRLFGTFRYYPPQAAIAEFLVLGPEPFDKSLTPDAFHSICKGRKLAIKDLLLDQKAIAGLGNIYACEALFQTRLNPFRRASNLTQAECQLLLTKIKEVLRLAIRFQGTSIRDYQNIDRQKGRFQNLLSVYGQASKPCPVCQRPIKRLVQKQRPTFFCPHCQKAPGP